MTEHVLCGDVGGTNTTLAIISLDKPYTVVSKARFQSKNIQDFTEFINDFMKNLHNDFNIIRACFAAAGPVVDDAIDMTNTDFVIDAHELVQKTELSAVLVINDFEAIAYATNALSEDDFQVLNKGESDPKGTKAVVGAGTGLGKAILFHHESYGYVPSPSEGGHSDFPYYGEEEGKLVNSILEKTGAHHAEYESILSGPGIETIYNFLQRTKYHDSPSNLSAPDISKSQDNNPCSRETMDYLIKFYARCCRNFALETLSTGGLYIAGGIAAKNKDNFHKFMEDFTKHVRYHDLLKSIPVILITNYSVSLLGAAYALDARQELCITE